MMRLRISALLFSLLYLLTGCATSATPQLGVEAAAGEVGNGTYHNGMAIVLSKESNETRIHGSIGAYYQHTSD